MSIRVSFGKLAAVAGAVIAARALLRHARAYDVKGKVVLITGGSRGLGLVMARELAARGAKLAICSRNPEQLARARDELAAVTQVFAIPCDITDPAAAIALVERTREALGPIDVLINNAGVIQVGPIEEMTTADYEQAMAIHFWAPLQLIRAVTPDMQRRGGRIVNISSIGGRIPVPHLAPYAASKFALAGLSEALRVELAAKGILVTTVLPGLMRTGSARNAQFKGRNREEYAWFSVAASAPLLTIGDKRAAAQIIDAMRAGDPEIVLSVPAKVAVLVHGLFPGLTQRLLSLVNGLLPEPGGIGKATRTGAESNGTPSRWTALGERAARRNNEL